MNAENNINSNNKENNPNMKEPLNPQEKKPKEKKYYGKLLITLILLVIIIQYYAYVYEVMFKHLTSKNYLIIITLLIVFHIFLFMLMWSFFRAMNTKPGDIPLYWGFYIGDDDNKRKRYCLICNAFKPERSHHCSVCNTCVLNMDHHCPWVDNCIGFYNRKFFMQLLIYTSILTIYMDFSEFYWVYLIAIELINMKVLYKDVIHVGIVLICYTFILVFSFIITMFLKFHIQLVLKNSTTIESLDKEHEEENAKFNIDATTNWEQVFGQNKLLWLIPIYTEKGRPNGDGLTWPVKKKTNLNESNNILPNTSNQEGPNVRNSNRDEENKQQQIEMGNNYNSNFNYASSSQPITSNKIKNESD